MLEEADELEAGEVVHAQHRVPVAAERSHMKGTCDVDEDSLRALISAAFGRFGHGGTSHSALRALRTWVAEELMELHDVTGVRPGRHHRSDCR